MLRNAQEVFAQLMANKNNLKFNGKIEFSMGGVNITVYQRDVVGNILQEWFAGWMDKNNIDYIPNPNTQMPPDFFLNPSNIQQSLLEVKAFNIESSPGFDIADFRMYQEEIIDKPYMLDVDYLIFGYSMNQKTGIVTIEDIWLKKVWEITRRMSGWALNLQIKNNVVHKIRPGSFYSNKSIPMFRNKEDFLSAIEETVYQNPKTHNQAGDWRPRFLDAYKKCYGVSLNIPHWHDIESHYSKP